MVNYHIYSQKYSDFLFVSVLILAASLVMARQDKDLNGVGCFFCDRCLFSKMATRNGFLHCLLGTCSLLFLDCLTDVRFYKKSCEIKFVKKNKLESDMETEKQVMKNDKFVRKKQNGLRNREKTLLQRKIKLAAVK